MNDTKTCDNCSKEDCAKCVEEGGKSFCCQNCCDDHRERQESGKGGAENVCRFC